MERTEKLPEPPEFDIKARDEYFWQEMQNIITERNYSLKEVMEHFPAYIMRRYMSKVFSHYEMFKNIIDLPGHVVELGIFRGRTLFTWSHLMDLFCPADPRRKIYGFDHFKGLDNFTEKDGSFEKKEGKIVGGWRSTEEEIQRICKIQNSDNIMPGTRRTRIVPGDLKETLPAFLEENPGFRISLLHFDVDLYEPTMYGLETLYPLVVKGGVICFDEYGVVPWQGETDAVDDFFSRQKKQPKIVKHPFTPFPHGYFIKE